MVFCMLFVAPQGNFVTFRPASASLNLQMPVEAYVMKQNVVLMRQGWVLVADREKNAQGVVFAVLQDLSVLLVMMLIRV